MTWTPRQRWTQVAAVPMVSHGAALHEWNDLGGALVHFLRFGLPEADRVWYGYPRARPVRAA